MRFLTLILWAFLAASLYAAPATPTNLTSTTGWVDSTITLNWDYVPGVPQWFIYLNGSTKASPTSAQISVLGLTRAAYTLSNVATNQLPAVINMRAYQSSVFSGYSNTITVTASGGSGTLISGTVSITNTVDVNCLNCATAGFQGVSVATSVLPTGASTEATLDKLTPASSGVTSNVSGSASSQIFFAANHSRKGFIVYNDSTATLYIKYGETASTTSFTEKLYSNSSYSETRYTGRVDGVWSSATGTARITELF